MEERPAYAEAFEELKRCVSELDRKEIPIDELSVKVRRAALLIGICKSALNTVDEDVAYTDGSLI